MTDPESEVFPTALHEAVVGEIKDVFGNKESNNQAKPEEHPDATNPDKQKTPEKETNNNAETKQDENADAKNNDTNESSNNVQNESADTPQKPSEKQSQSNSTHDSPRNNEEDSKEQENKNEDLQNDNDESMGLSNIIKDKLDDKTDELGGEEEEKKEKPQKRRQEEEEKKEKYAEKRTELPKNEEAPKKEIPKKLTYVQEQQRIPEKIRMNKYVARRTNTYFVTNTTIPRAAATTHSEYRSKSNEVELDEYTQAVLNKNEPEEDPTIEQLKATASQLRRLEQQKINEQKYAEASKASDANEYINRKMAHTQQFNSSKEYIQDLIAKRNELAALLEYIEKKYDKDLETQQQANDERLQQIVQQQQQELEEFDASVPTELQPLFKRNSVTYWKLRSEEKNLAINKKFDEAIKKKASADKLQKFEDQQNLEKMTDYYNNKRVKLLELHDKAISNFQLNADARIFRIKAEKKKAMVPMQTRCQMIERLVEKLCAKKGIRAQHLDFEQVDEDRVEMLKKTELEGILIPKRSSTSMSCRTAPIHKPKLQQSSKV